jgi:hypothetical protein
MIVKIDMRAHLLIYINAIEQECLEVSLGTNGLLIAQPVFDEL